MAETLADGNVVYVVRHSALILAHNLKVAVRVRIAVSRRMESRGADVVVVPPSSKIRPPRQVSPLPPALEPILRSRSTQVVKTTSIQERQVDATSMVDEGQIGVDAGRLGHHEQEVFFPRDSPVEALRKGMIAEADTSVDGIDDEALDDVEAVARYEAFELAELADRHREALVVDAILLLAVESPLDVQGVGDGLAVPGAARVGFEYRGRNLDVSSGCLLPGGAVSARG